MRLRTRLNLVVAGLSATFVVVLITAEILGTRESIREEIVGANRVASLLLGHIATLYTNQGRPEQVQQFLEQLGRIRANDVSIRAASGEELYRSPAPTYKAGRNAPAWFTELLAPPPTRHSFRLGGGAVLTVQTHSSRAVLDAWDNVTWLFGIGVVMLIIANGLAFWLVGRALEPFPVIAAGLESIEQGNLAFRLPQFSGSEAGAIGAAFNRMAHAVEDKVAAERKARDAETRLEERREMASVADQRVEEERRLIAHELHDEFGQSVTAIRSLAVAIGNQTGTRDAGTGEMARLISDEAGRLYDAMHGLIPRLAPLSLDSLGLAATLESLINDWRRRYPDVALTLRQDLEGDLGPSVTLTIYRVVQEGLINALRHARPKAVNVTVRCDAQQIVAVVADDGIGLPADWSRPGHFGLKGLTERVTQLGGSFDIGVSAGGGVQLTAAIPLVVKP